MLRELGGLALLSAGSIALLVILFTAAITVWFGARCAKRQRDTWIFGSLAAMALVLVLTWDEIAGRAYFRHLCASNSGIEISQRITLGPEYRDVQFPSAPWLYKKMPISALYPYSVEVVEDLPGPARIQYVKQLIREGKTGAILGTTENYFYGGGWFRNAVSLHGAGGGSCDFDADHFRSLLERIFRVTR